MNWTAIFRTFISLFICTAISFGDTLYAYPLESTLATSFSTEDPEQVLKNDIRAQLIKNEWQIKSLALDISTLSLNELSCLNDLRLFISAISSNLWTDKVKEELSIDILQVVREQFSDPNTLISTLISLEVFTARRDVDMDSRSLHMLNLIASIPSLTAKTKKEINDILYPYILETRTPMIRYHKAIKTHIIAGTIQIMGMLGPIDNDFHEILLPFTFSGFKTEIRRAAITAFMQNKEAVLDTLVTYYRDPEKHKSKVELAQLIDILIGHTTYEKLKSNNNVFYYNANPHKKNTHHASPTRAALQLLYHTSCAEIVDAILECCGGHIPSFHDWTQSPLGEYIEASPEHQYESLVPAFTHLIAFRSIIGEENFSLLLQYWGFSYVLAWSEVNYFTYRTIFKVIIDATRHHDTLGAQQSSLLVSIVARLNEHDNHTYAIHQLFFELILSGSFSIDYKFIFSILEEIVNNPDDMRILISFLIIALNFRIVDIPDTEFLEERVSRLLHSDFGPQYYFVMKLIDALPLKTNLFDNNEKFIRDTVRTLDESDHKGKNSLFHYLRLKIHREISKNSLYLIDAILSGLSTGSKQSLVAALDPLIKNIAKREVYLSIEKLDLGAYHSIMHAIRPDDTLPLHTLTPEHTSPILAQLKRNHTREATTIEKLITLRFELTKKYSTIFDVSMLHNDDIKKTFERLLTDSVRTQFSHVIDEITESKHRETSELLSLIETIQVLLAEKKNALLTRSEIADFSPEKSSYSDMHQVLDDFNFLLFGVWTQYKETKYDMMNDMRFLERIQTSLLAQSHEVAQEKLRAFKIYITRNPNKELSPRARQHLDYLLMHTCKLIDFLEHKGIAQPRLKMFRDILLYEPLTLQQLNDLLGIIAYDAQPRFERYINRKFGNLPAKIAKSIGIENLDFAYSDTRIPTTYTDTEKSQLVQEIFYGNFFASDPSTKKLYAIAKSLQETTTAADDTYIYSIEKQSVASPTFSPHESTRKNRAHRAVTLGSKSFNLHKFPNYTPSFETLDIPYLSNPEHRGRKALRQKALELIITLERKTQQRFPLNYVFLSKDEIKQLSETRNTGPNKYPLLVSVRSGSFISLPGALETVLDVGITRQYINHLTTHQTSPELALFLYHSYYRFLWSFAVAQGNIHEELLIEHQNRFLKSVHKTDLTELDSDEFNDFCTLLENIYNDHAETVVDLNDPLAMLTESILAVYNSWNSETATNYRTWNNVSNQWKTSVTIQQMVHGNLNKKSFTGIVTLEDGRPAGSIVFGRGGEAIASGYASRGISLGTLAEREPSLYNSIIDILEKAYRIEGQNVYLELTGEYHPDQKGDDRYTTYLLQERVLHRKKIGTSERWEIKTNHLPQPATQGVGITGGVQHGVFINGVGSKLPKLKSRIEMIRQQLDKTEEGKNVGIFLLFDFFGPAEGVKALHKNVAGIVTTNIGDSTHASYVAYREGKIFVAEVPNLERNKKQWFLNGQKISPNDTYTIVGYPPHKNPYSGAIFEGKIPLRQKKEITAPSPKSRTKKRVSRKSSTTHYLSAA